MIRTLSLAAAAMLALTAFATATPTLAVGASISKYCRDDVPASDPHKRPGGWCDIIADNHGLTYGNKNPNHSCPEGSVEHPFTVPHCTPEEPVTPDL